MTDSSAPDPGPGGPPGMRAVTCSADTLREALRALGAPEELLTIRWVTEPEHQHDPEVLGEVADEQTQTIGLAALLHRVATSIRAGVAIEFQSLAANAAPEDEPAARVDEARMLDIDRRTAWAADDTVLVARSAQPRALATRQFNRAAQVNRVCEEARWLAETFGAIVHEAHTDAVEATQHTECSDKVPAALYVARTLARSLWSLAMIAYIELADPDQVDSNEAGLLGEVLTGMRQSSAVLLRYGTNRGLLRRVEGPRGEPTYEVVTDIVAAATGTGEAPGPSA